MLRSLLSYGCPEDVAPFITEDKLHLVLSRWLQSWLGGVHIRRALSAHIKVNVLQVVIFVVPPVLGAGLSVVELDLQVKSVIFGFSVLALVVVLQSAVFLLRRNYQAPRRATRKSIDDTDTHVNRKLFSSLLLDMLFPPKTLLDEAFSLSLTFGAAALCMRLLSVQDLGAYGAAYADCALIENFLGWTVYATSQYPLSARCPVDVNSWQVGDSSALDDAQRAVYVCCLAGADWILSMTDATTVVRIAVRYTLFATPVLINFGILPPTTALAEYVLEQGLGVAFGYAPKEDTALLLLYATTYVAAAAVVLGVAVNTESAPCSMAAAAILGRWITGGHIRGLKAHLTLTLARSSSNKVMPFPPEPERTMVSEADLKGSFREAPKRWRRLLLSPRSLVVMHYGSVVVVSVGFTVGFAALSNSTRHTCKLGLLGLVLGLWLLTQLRIALLLPSSIVSRLCPLHLHLPIGLLEAVGTGIYWILGPSLYLILSCFFADDAASSSRVPTVWVSAAMLHAWTTTQHNPFVACYSIWLAGVFAYSTDYSFATSVFLGALVHPRLWHLWDTAQYMWVVYSSIIFKPKQRFTGWVAITFLGLPVSVVSLALSTVLLAPLYPLCGSTLFFVGFPRPRRFWQAFTPYHDGMDGTYYEHMFEALALDLPGLLAPSSVLCQRSPCVGRDVFFLRVDNFLGLLEVLELSATTAVVRFKGLELQETTSCHHLEASKLDDAIASAFANSDADDAEDDVSPLGPCVFRPLLRTPVRMYGVSSALLADYLDDPECLRLIHDAFFITLVTELNRVTHGSVPDIWLSFPVSISGLDFVLKEFPTIYWDYLQAKNKKIRQIMNPRGLLDDPPLVEEVAVPTPPVREPRRSSLRLAADALARLVHILRPTRVSVANVPSTRATITAPVKRTSVTDRTGSTKQRLEISYGLQEADTSDAVNYAALAQQRPTISGGARRSFLWGDIDGHVEAEPPPPVRPGAAVRPSFLRDRWNKVSEFHMLAASCFAIVQTLGFGSHEKPGPMHVYQCFHGIFPRSLENDWLKANATLYEIVVRAYRLAVKLGLDKFAEGDVDLYDSPEELEATIQYYKTKWYIGPPNTTMHVHRPRVEASWGHYVSTNRPNLFALTKNANGKIMSTIYTLGRQDATVVAVNRAACEGTWHGLALELLYMANDDDERFSIQSNPQLLRNLLVQAADPPMGYPVYSTGPVVIKF
ncbi:pecanex-like protein 4 [Achlya hypogyna]|uniref:Pecanex-like protein 4 n=1 Tax=Achlya hypogyna TaxID=1202772 RepID=A0A1V9YIU8_ACHHY|nr:pecanex-like protein 4 [Achlya hypogyna]